MRIPHLISFRGSYVVNKFSAGNTAYDVVSLHQCLEAIGPMRDCMALGVFQPGAFSRSGRF